MCGCVDLSADKYPGWSAYAYTLNNPLKFIDPDGQSPEDIIINNKDGEEMARIIMDTGDHDIIVKTDIDYSPDERHTLDLQKTIDQSEDHVDAVGINLEVSATVGGGMEGGISMVYFLGGEDEGTAHWYSYKGGNVGYGGGISGDFFVSNFDADADKSFFNAEGFAGSYNSYSGTALGYGSSKNWSNEKNKHDEIFPGHRHQTTWTSRSVGGDVWSPRKMGKFSAKFSGGKSTY